MHVSASGNYSSPAFIGDLAFIITLASNSRSLSYILPVLC